MTDTTVKLLTEIRDLLVPVAEVARPQYEAIMRDRHQQAIRDIVEIAGRSPKQLEAAQLMDGTRTAQEIRTSTGFDTSNFSKFQKRLRDAGVLKEEGGKLTLVVSPRLIPWKA